MHSIFRCVDLVKGLIRDLSEDEYGPGNVLFSMIREEVKEIRDGVRFSLIM